MGGIIITATEEYKTKGGARGMPNTLDYRIGFSV
jgi:hypothetical protein